MKPRRKTKTTSLLSGAISQILLPSPMRKLKMKKTSRYKNGWKIIPQRRSNALEQIT